MMFDWLRFLRDHHIPYVTEGPNTSKGNASIACPWCGSADKSQHMGLSLDANHPFFGCWRNRSHRGSHPEFLIAKLLGLSREQAKRYVEVQGSNPDAFAEAMASLTKEKEEKDKKRQEIKWPETFRKFSEPEAGRAPFESRFFDYLKVTRGFGTSPRTWQAIDRFNLHWCLQGEYTGRIIIPVFDHTTDILACWQGRAITKKAVNRYKSLEDEKSYRNIKDCLLFPYDWEIKPNETLVVTEGAFDAIKLDTFGTEFGVTATCIFGLTLQPAQLLALSKLRGKFRRLVILLDATATPESAIMVSQIGEFFGSGVSAGSLPEGVKDPGDLTPAQAVTLAKSLSGFGRGK